MIPVVLAAAALAALATPHAATKSTGLVLFQLHAAPAHAAKGQDKDGFSDKHNEKRDPERNTRPMPAFSATSSITSASMGVHTGIFRGSSPDLNRVWVLSHRSCSQDLHDECNHKFEKQMQDMKQSARKAGITEDKTFAYFGLPEFITSDKKWEDYLQPGMRGRGYWFWKAALTKHLLNDPTEGIKDGDRIIYADGDTPSWIEVVLGSKIAQNSSVDMVVRRQTFCEKDWTKGDIFTVFGVNVECPHYAKTQQYWANQWMIRANERTKQFIDTWEQLAQDYHLISDEPSTISNDATSFRENRHDQSLFSMLLKASVKRNGQCGKPDEERSEEDYVLHVDIDDGLAPWTVDGKFGIPGLRVAQFS